MPKLILASGSPRRAEILRSAGFVFDVCPANIDETRAASEPAHDYVRRLAEAKARAAASQLKHSDHAAGAIVIGADTVAMAGVAPNEEMLGKPANPAEARAMLELLSGGSHQLVTGLALLEIPRGRISVVEEATRVEFAALTSAEIDDYLATGEPFDKAGAYAIQGRGGRFVKRIEGCYFNVMGLPLGRLYAELRRLGWDIRGDG